MHWTSWISPWKKYCSLVHFLLLTAQYYKYNKPYMFLTQFSKVKNINSDLSENFQAKDIRWQKRLITSPDKKPHGRFEGQAQVFVETYPQEKIWILRKSNLIICRYCIRSDWNTLFHLLQVPPDHIQENTSNTWSLRDRSCPTYNTKFIKTIRM